MASVDVNQKLTALCKKVEADAQMLDKLLQRMLAMPPPAAAEPASGSADGKAKGATTFAGMDENLADEPEDNANDDGGLFSPAQQLAKILAGQQQSIDNDGPFASLTDVIFVASSVFTCILVISMWHPLNKYDFDESPPFNIIVWFAFLAVSSLVWIALRFFMRVRRDWDIIDEIPLIQRFYVRSWFPFDLFICLPLELCFVSWANQLFYLFTLRHFLRYLRMFELGNSTNPLLPSRSWFRFTHFLATMALVAHMVGCIFWSLQYSKNSNLTYIESLYWAVATMTTVGYGDIVPTQDTGRVFSIFSSLLGVMVIATLTAASSHFATSTDTLTEELNTKKMTMYAMLKHYNVPWSVQREVIQIFPSALTTYTEQKFKEHLELLPKFMQTKLMGFFQRRCAPRPPHFQGRPAGRAPESLRRHVEAFRSPRRLHFRSRRPGKGAYFPGPRRR